jgi:hypothetical protein
MYRDAGVAALGVPITIDGHMGLASVADINKVDSGSLMVELVSLSMRHYTDVAAAKHRGGL